MMGRRSHNKIMDTVPEDIRKELDERLLDGMRLIPAAEWLTSLGYPTGKSTVGRYWLSNVQPLQKMFQRAEAFRAVLSEGGERPATELHEAANLLLTDAYLELLMELGADDRRNVKQLVSLSKGLSMIQSSAVANEKLKASTRQRLEAAFGLVMRDLGETLGESHPALLEQLESVVADRQEALAE